MMTVQVQQILLLALPFHQVVQLTQQHRVWLQLVVELLMMMFGLNLQQPAP